MFMVLAFTPTANAQQPLGVISCSATPVTPLVRAEAVSDVAGDIDIVCTNTPGVSEEVELYLPTNLNVLATNTNFTNSLGLVGGAAFAQVEAVVVINANNSTKPSATSDVPPTGGDEPDDRFPGPQFGILSGDTLLTWNGIQFPVPGAPNDGDFTSGDSLSTCNYFTETGEGTGCFPGATTIKIGHIRVNVSGLASPAQVSVIVSMTGETNIPIFPNVLNIALPLIGLTWSVGPDDPVLVGLQCEDAVEDFLHPILTLNEGFATAFKTLGVPTFVPGNTQVESSYHSFGSGFTGGGATQGTRIKVWFLNVPDGVDVSVPVSVNNSSTDPTDNCSSTANWDGDALCLHLIDGEDEWGAGGSFADYGSVGGPVAVDIDSDGMGMAVYEVLDGNSFATESIDIAVWYEWESDTALDEPKPGTTQIRANFAPLATLDGDYGFVADPVDADDTTSPRPRFIDTGGSPVDAASIRRCTTTLLFPWVVNVAGFDMGVAISNTSADWLETENQAGICTVHWHGTDTAGGTFSDTVSSTIGAGKQFVFLVSNEAPGFTGYIIVVCEFQFAHGFGYITDGFGGITTTAQGYLALILHYYDNDGARVAAETLGH